VTIKGYVVFVRSLSPSRTGSELYYRIGEIDPHGDTDQTIEWKTEFLHWDAGFHSSIAINDQGVIVGVHESNHTPNNNLHYRLGHLRNPAAGDYTIAWDSGHFGIRYDSGINPHIAINNRNQVVEVHQTASGDFLHYRRGTVNFGATGATIDFGESQRYDSYAWHPAVGLLDNGLALEVHIGTDRKVFSRVGQPSLSNPAIIEWFPKKLSGGSQEYTYPVIGTNGVYAVEIREMSERPFFRDLLYSVAEVGNLESSMAD
jgi:hypothetical protein